MKLTPVQAKHTKLHRLLRQIRLDRSLTQSELAEKLKRPQSFVSKYESGERRLDLVELQEICHSVGVDLKRFVEMFEKDKYASK